MDSDTGEIAIQYKGEYDESGEFIADEPLVQKGAEGATATATEPAAAAESTTAEQKPEATEGGEEKPAD